jgi:hypothetical protein
MFVRSNVSATNGKELSPTVDRRRAEYCNELSEGDVKRELEMHIAK